MAKRLAQADRRSGRRAIDLGDRRSVRPHVAARPESIDEVADLARQCRRRGVRREGSVSPGKFSALLVDGRVAVSGVAAAGRHGAAVDENAPHVVYVRRSDIDSVIARYRIDANHSVPNLIVWVVDDQWWPFDELVVPAVVALVDLVAERGIDYTL